MSIAPALRAPSASSTLATPRVAPPPRPSGRPFLTAQWRDLVMLSYEVDPTVLAPYVPRGTQLDSWQGRTFASIVGFFFRTPRLFGMPIPLHASFEEVNLRFYVRREAAEGVRRGVVFLRELVPKRAVAWVARYGFGQNFLRVPMSHELDRPSGDVGLPPSRLAFAWRHGGRDCHANIETDPQHPGLAQHAAAGSLEEFIAEHYWAYAAVHGRTRQYCVVHPPWLIAPAVAAEFSADVRTLYGPEFVPYLSGRPASAFWADGSAVAVHGS